MSRGIRKFTRRAYAIFGISCSILDTIKRSEDTITDFQQLTATNMSLEPLEVRLARLQAGIAVAQKQYWDFVVERYSPPPISRRPSVTALGHRTLPSPPPRVPAPREESPGLTEVSGFDYSLARLDRFIRQLDGAPTPAHHASNPAAVQIQKGKRKSSASPPP